MAVYPPLSTSVLFGTSPATSPAPGHTVAVPVRAYNAPSPASAGGGTQSLQSGHFQRPLGVDETRVLATLATLCIASKPEGEFELDDGVRLALCVTLVGHAHLSDNRGMQVHFRNSEGNEDSLDLEATEGDNSDPIVIRRVDGRLPIPADLCNALGGERLVAEKLGADVAIAVPAMTAELSRTALDQWVFVSRAWHSARAGHSEPSTRV